MKLRAAAKFLDLMRLLQTREQLMAVLEFIEASKPLPRTIYNSLINECMELEEKVIHR